MNVGTHFRLLSAMYRCQQRSGLPEVVVRFLSLAVFKQMRDDPVRDTADEISWVLHGPSYPPNPRVFQRGGQGSLGVGC